jgi:hypothetical protein
MSLSVPQSNVESNPTAEVETPSTEKSAHVVPSTEKEKPVDALDDSDAPAEDDIPRRRWVEPSDEEKQALLLVAETFSLSVPFLFSFCFNFWCSKPFFRIVLGELIGQRPSIR